jgi:hypothetical protein
MGIDERWKTPPETLREMTGIYMDKGLLADSMTCMHLAHQVEAYMTNACSMWVPTGSYSIWRPGKEPSVPAFLFMYNHWDV